MALFPTPVPYDRFQWDRAPEASKEDETRQPEAAQPAC